MYLPQPPIHGATHVIQLNVKGRYILFELPEAADRQSWYARARGRRCRQSGAAGLTSQSSAFATDPVRAQAENAAGGQDPGGAAAVLGVGAHPVPVRAGLVTLWSCSNDVRNRSLLPGDLQAARTRVCVPWLALRKVCDCGKQQPLCTVGRAARCRAACFMHVYVSCTMR